MRRLEYQTLLSCSSVWRSQTTASAFQSSFQCNQVFKHWYDYSSSLSVCQPFLFDRTPSRAWSLSLRLRSRHDRVRNPVDIPTILSKPSEIKTEYNWRWSWTVNLQTNLRTTRWWHPSFLSPWVRQQICVYNASFWQWELWRISSNRKEHRYPTEHKHL